MEGPDSRKTRRAGAPAAGTRGEGHRAQLPAEPLELRGENNRRLLPRVRGRGTDSEGAAWLRYAPGGEPIPAGAAPAATPAAVAKQERTMSGFPVLDVAIGLAFVYLLLALICTTVMEWIAQIRKTRGKMLERSVQQRLDEGSSAKAVITKALFELPLIQALPYPKLPQSYIPGKLFAK